MNKECPYFMIILWIVKAKIKDQEKFILSLLLAQAFDWPLLLEANGDLQYWDFVNLTGYGTAQFACICAAFSRKASLKISEADGKDMSCVQNISVCNTDMVDKQCIDVLS